MTVADEQVMSLQPGTVVGGRYEVIKCLGAGSMGLVYACRHRELSGHLVAVKVLFPEVAQDKVAAARFRNEIFASYHVSHPNVVRAYDYIKDGDLVAYTMEYVGGGALADKLDSGIPIPIPDVIRMLAQMCAGVQSIHDAGIVHRDLKPENILLTKDGVVKIGDFGIARTGHGPKLTEHGGVVGTIDYVSPEYMLNAQVDWRSDIYALGILAYEMITGESPFRGDSVYATMTKRLKTDPKPPSSMRPDCPRGLDVIVLKAMARDPEQRYQAAADILADLQALAPGQRLVSGAYTQPGRGSGAISPQQLQSSDAGSNPQTSRSSLDNEGRARPSAGINGSTGHHGQLSRRKDRSDSPHRNAGQVKGGIEHSYVDADDTISEEENRSAVGTFASSADTIEPLMSGSNRGQLGGRRARAGRDVSVSQGGIGSERVRELSQIADRPSPSLWADVLILVIAAVIGVAVGLAVLNIFFPEILKSTADSWSAPLRLLKGDIK